MKNPLDDARYYARLGWPVFPCRPDKRPYTANGFKDATTRLEQIERWWRQHPDALIGAPTGIDFDVLDADPRHGGDRTLSALERDHGVLPPTWIVETPGGRRHAFLSPSPEAPHGANRYGHLLPDRPKVTGLDVRARGGYVILPPSVAEHGEYRWLRGPDDTELATWPAWALRPDTSSNGGPPPVSDVIPHGAQHDTLVSLGGSMRRRGMGEEEIFQALRVTNEARCERPGPDRHIRQIARSLTQYEPEGRAAGAEAATGGRRAAVLAHHARPPQHPPTTVGVRGLDSERCAERRSGLRRGRQGHLHVLADRPVDPRRAAGGSRGEVRERARGR